MAVPRCLAAGSLDGRVGSGAQRRGVQAELANLRQDGREMAAMDATGDRPQADHTPDQLAVFAQTLDLPGALVRLGARFRAVTQLAVPQILAAEQSDVTVNQDFRQVTLDRANRVTLDRVCRVNLDRVCQVNLDRAPPDCQEQLDEMDVQG